MQILAVLGREQTDGSVISDNSDSDNKMLRIIIVSLAAFGFCASRPQSGLTIPQILEYINTVGPFGYHFRYSTSDGVGREESGELKYPGTPEENYVVQGKTSWTSPDGKPFIVTFISDNSGYRTSEPQEYRPYVPSVYSSAANNDSGDRQRIAGGIVPAGPPKIGAGTAASLIG